MRKVLGLLLAGACLCPATAGAELRAGVAVADITPENGATTFGFVRPDITVQGVHTRLTGRALVLDDGTQVVALLSTDLGAPFRCRDAAPGRAAAGRAVLRGAVR